MPIYLRRFYLKKMIDYKKEEEAHMKKAQSRKGSAPSTPPMPRR
tara:strand:- start:286 stop:417 length:132 start_codon:yes stop_codon:yes gene_type:complete